MNNLFLCNDIYTIASIDRAIKAYAGFAKIEKESVRKGTILKFSKCKFDEEKTIFEFENYVIQIENNNLNKGNKAEL